MTKATGRGSPGPLALHGKSPQNLREGDWSIGYRSSYQPPCLRYPGDAAAKRPSAARTPQALWETRKTHFLVYFAGLRKIAGDFPASRCIQAAEPGGSLRRGREARAPPGSTGLPARLPSQQRILDMNSWLILHRRSQANPGRSSEAAAAPGFPAAAGLQHQDLGSDLLHLPWFNSSLLFPVSFSFTQKSV